MVTFSLGRRRLVVVEFSQRPTGVVEVGGGDLHQIAIVAGGLDQLAFLQGVGPARFVGAATGDIARPLQNEIQHHLAVLDGRRSDPNAVFDPDSAGIDRLPITIELGRDIGEGAAAAAPFQQKDHGIVHAVTVEITGEFSPLDVFDCRLGGIVFAGRFAFEQAPRSA